MPDPPLGLSVRLRHRMGALEVDVNFELARPWTILFGPSGSGKTTILRAIAGLLRPDFARIVVSGLGGTQSEIVLVDTTTGVFVPPHARQIPLALQRASLFPHRTVAENVRFGLHGHSAPSRDEQLRGLLARFEIEDLQRKYPNQLSGGEAQRVNLARTVAARGRVLLLDEPFTGLDALRRSQLEAVLADIARQQGTPILSVTHDLAEPFEVKADVIRLDQGRIVCRGPAIRVLERERTRMLDQLGVSGTAVASAEPFLGG